jgi:hypothetical protein
MRTSLQAVVIALGVTVFWLTPPASAEPKDEVAAATAAWAQALGEDDPEKVLPLYASDAVLWGTLSPKLRSDPAALRDYFVTAFKILPGLSHLRRSVDPRVRQHGNQHGLLHLLLCAAEWRKQNLPSSL